MTSNRVNELLPESEPAAVTTPAPKFYVLRGIFVGVTMGCLAGLLPLALLMIDIPIFSLQTGIRVLDSLMYSAPGSLGLWIAGAVWGLFGACLGGILGLMIGLFFSSRS